MEKKVISCGLNIIAKLSRKGIDIRSVSSII